MQRAYHRWHARHLGRDMELLVFGTGGVPTIVFPTSMGAFYDYEDRGMVKAIEDKINRGAVQLFCVSTIDTESFYAKDRPARARLDWYLAYERYLLEDVVPLVVQTNGSTSIALTGCSFGAYHSFVMALRHPAIFTACTPMGGAFDITQFLDG